MSRDWHKDKRYLQELNEWETDPDDQDLFNIAINYHCQYAAEKARADNLELRLNRKSQLLLSTHASRDEARRMYKDALDGASQEKERADKAEAREKILREAIKNIRTITSGSTAYTDAAYAHYEAHKTLTSLYPLPERNEEA